MEILSLVLAALALAVALIARGRAAGLERRLDEAAADARRRAENAGGDLERALETTRRHLAQLAAGGRPTREMILEGRLWGDVSPEEGRRLLESGAVRVLDVRTPAETQGGILPGALLIPLDQLPARLAELPPEARPTLVYCAAGMRSAAACELLSQEGHELLLNLEGGFSSWPGERKKPGN